MQSLSRDEQPGTVNPGADVEAPGDDLYDEDVAEDGAKHTVGDDCLAVHYVDRAGRLACGADFMAGTICSLLAGHLGPDEAACLDCGGDWVNGTCTCPAADDE